MNEEQINIINLLLLLDEGERMEIFYQFCVDCGVYSPDKKCQCWDDE